MSAVALYPVAVYPPTMKIRPSAMTVATQLWRPVLIAPPASANEASAGSKITAELRYV